MPEATGIDRVRGDILQEQQRLMQHVALMRNKEVKRAWKAYRKSVGKKSVHMPLDMWLDYNYPQGSLSEGNVRSTFRHEEATQPMKPQYYQR